MAAGKPQTVLVVEDEASIASFVSLYLKNAGYTVRTASTGTDVRFRMIGGAFKIRIWGSGIDLSVAAKGWGRIKAADSNTGWYALNGGDRHQLPSDLTKFVLVSG